MVPLGSLGAAERAAGQAICPIAESESEQGRLDLLRLNFPTRLRDEWTVEKLSRTLNMPASTSLRAVQSLAADLREQAELLNLSLSERSTMSRPEVIIPYDPEFLGDGFNAPLPTLKPQLLADAYAQGAVLDYTHYSLVMQARRRVAAFTAHNVDAARLVRVSGGLSWKMDERAGEYQLGPEMYANNQIDKGHLVRRADVLWGSVAEARAANKATYFYTNAAPQHQNFNQDEWVALEDWVLEEATDYSFRLCVFTGPVLRPEDPVLSDLPPDLRRAFRMQGAGQIPAAFWKIIVLRDALAGGDDLSAVAFAMKQSEMWADRDGSRLLQLKVHQVTIGAIEEWSGLDFGDLRNVDELQWSERMTRAAEEPVPFPVVRSKSDIVYWALHACARCASNSQHYSIPRKPARKSDWCDGSRAKRLPLQFGSFDAATAVAALSRDVSRLTQEVANLKGAAVRGQPRAVVDGAAAPAPANVLSNDAEGRVQRPPGVLPTPFDCASRARCVR